MKLGELVESLIYMRDHHQLTRDEDEAVCEACNILDELPPGEGYEEARAKLSKIKMNGKEWVCFYGPDGHFLGGYSWYGTFDGEEESTKELLAAEAGISPDEITVRLQRAKPREGADDAVKAEPDRTVCPRCGKAYTEKPALSRKDNRTLICPDCGTREALESVGIFGKDQDAYLEAVNRARKETEQDVQEKDA